MKTNDHHHYDIYDDSSREVQRGEVRGEEIGARKGEREWEITRRRRKVTARLSSEKVNLLS